MAEGKAVKDLLKEMQKLNSTVENEIEESQSRHEDFDKGFEKIGENIELLVIGMSDIVSAISKNYEEGIGLMFTAFNGIESVLMSGFKGLNDNMGKSMLGAKTGKKDRDNRDFIDAEIGKDIKSSNIYLKNIRDSVLSLPNELASFLGWGQLYNLVFNNPIVKFVKDLGSNFGRFLLGGKSDRDDEQRKTAEQRSFLEKHFTSFHKLLDKILGKSDTKSKTEGPKEEKSLWEKLAGFIGGMFRGIGSLISRIPLIGAPIIGLITKLVGALSAGLKFMISGLTSGMMALSKFAVSAFSKLGKIFIQIWEKVMPKSIQSMFTTIGEFFSKVFSSVFSKAGASALSRMVSKTLMGSIGFIVDFIIGFIKGGFGEGLKEMILGGDGILGAIFNSLKYAVAGASMGGPVGAIIGAVSGLVISLIKSWVKSVFGDHLQGKGALQVTAMIVGYISAFINDMVESLVKAVKWISDAVLGVFKSIVEGIVSAGKWYISYISKAFKFIIDGVVSAGKWVINNFMTIMKNYGIYLWDGLKKMIDLILHPSKIVALLDKAKDWMVEKFEKLWNIVLDAIFGIIEKISSYSKYVLEGMEIYQKRKKAKEEEERLEKERKKREEREERERKRKEKLEEDKLKSENAHVKMTDRLTGAYDKLAEKVESSSMIDKSVDFINKMLGDAYQFLARGASTGSKYSSSTRDSEQFWKVSQESLRQNRELIKRMSEDRSEKDRIKALEKQIEELRKAKQTETEPTLVNNNNVVNNNNNNYFGFSVAEQSFDFQHKKYAHGMEV